MIQCNNLYELTTDEYNKLLTENISKIYRKCNLSTMYIINAEAKVIVEDLKIDKRIEQYNQKQSFIMLKDLKENLKNNPKHRLINPAKSEIGIVSKEHTDTINKIIREKTYVKQWRNTDAVVMWFQNIKNKDISLFIKFDIVDFYPISKDLLINAITFAKSITPIDDKIIKTYIKCPQIVTFQQK